MPLETRPHLSYPPQVPDDNPTWGGAREGAGRPKELHEKTTSMKVNLEPKHKRKLQRLAKARSLSMAATIRRLIEEA